MSKTLVIFGVGKLAEMADFVFGCDSDYEIAAFTVHAKYIREHKFRGRPVLAFNDLESVYSPKNYKLFVAVGYSGMNRFRADICQQAKEKGYRLASYVSSKATVWPDFNCGDNCFILEHNNVQPFVKIGNNVILWSGNHVGHHSVIEDNVYIASHAVISGGVTVGSNTFVGVNATIRDEVTIGPRSIIGASAYVSSDVQAGAVVLPAKSRVAGVTSDRVKI